MRKKIMLYKETGLSIRQILRLMELENDVYESTKWPSSKNRGWMWAWWRSES